MPPVPTVRSDGEAVQRWRIRRGLTTPKLGAMIGRDGSTIRHIENRPGKLASEVLINQIANALKIDVSLLIKDDAEDEPNGAAAVAAVA